MQPHESAAEQAWSLIEAEKKRDQFVRRVGRIAWVVTFAIVLLFAVMTGAQVAQTLKVFSEGAVPWTIVFWSAMPLISVLGIISLLIATLATVGVFLRLRTASLMEIQVRLAALEDLLKNRA